MAQIIGTGTAVPPYRVDQAQAQAYAQEHFRSKLPAVERMGTVFKHAAIETRYFVVPPDWWFRKQHSLQERNEIYLREATLLAQAALTQALDAARLAPEQIDHLIVVSSTGIATPSLDAWLINRMGLRSDIRRTPIWGLGCAGGVAGLARAAELTRAYPNSVTALVAVETCGLTFQFDDASKKNFIATSLFGDGAAAAVLTETPRPEQGIDILDSQSTLWPDSLRVMGWDVVEGGLAVVFGAEIPAYVAERFRPEVDRFLAKQGLEVRHIQHFVFHPGGAKVIHAYDQALDLTNGHLDPSREILRHYGNMSSPTVLFVLDYVVKQIGSRPGDYGLLAALGPGFSAEQVLVKF